MPKKKSVSPSVAIAPIAVEIKPPPTPPSIDGSLEDIYAKAKSYCFKRAASSTTAANERDALNALMKTVHARMRALGEIE